MTHGSLFTGIGGIDLGFEWAGMETLWQVENDPYAIKVLEKRWPDVRRYTDIKEIGAKELAWVDVISGGFPCQNISIAGKGAGIEGARSGLWVEMCRIIGELRPRYTLIENVPAITFRGLDRVLADLAEIGYDAEWTVISASDVGALHLRKRVWIVAYPNSQMYRCVHGQIEIEPTEKPHDAQCDTCTVCQERQAEVAYPASERGCGRNTGREDAENVGESPRCPQEGYWDSEPDVGRVAHGVPFRVDRLKCLGNAVVPQNAHLIGRMIIDDISRGRKQVNCKRNYAFGKPRACHVATRWQT